MCEDWMNERGEEWPLSTGSRPRKGPRIGKLDRAPTLTCNFVAYRCL